MYLGNNYFFPRSLSNVFLSLFLFLWVVEVPDADPLGFQGSGLLPTLVSCQIRERGTWRWVEGGAQLVLLSSQMAVAADLPLSLSFTVHFFSYFVEFIYCFFLIQSHYASNQTLSHMHALSHSLVHVNSAVQLTADQYEKCYENDTRTPHCNRRSCLFYANKRCLIVFNSTSTSEFHSDKAYCTVKSECGF